VLEKRGAGRCLVGRKARVLLEVRVQRQGDPVASRVMRSYGGMGRDPRI
jgi:hypothetical protein